jgi:hypothetical protein
LDCCAETLFFDLEGEAVVPEIDRQHFLNWRKELMYNIQFLELHNTIFLEQKVVILNLVMESPVWKPFTSNDK